MRDHAGVIQREVGLLLDDVTRLVERAAELERHFTLSGKALEKLSASAAKISSRGKKLVSLDLDDESAETATETARLLTSRASGS
jgi:DNA recombination protein RmuC